MLHNPIMVKLSNNHLEKKGWENASIKHPNGVTPWFTYGALNFLADIITPDLSVFEYGSGSSTIFFNCNVKKVVSVEHDARWAEKLLSLNNNCDIRIRQKDYINGVRHEDLMRRYKAQDFIEPRGNPDHDVLHGLVSQGFEGYAAELLTEPHQSFDIIVVDGMARQLCGFVAADVIKDDGFIILDNSDRWQYNSLQRYLVNKGFGRIDFWGAGPKNTVDWCTSFFSRKFLLNNLHVERPAGTGDLGW